MIKLNSKTYFQRHENEINRFINSNTKWIHILNQDNAFKDFTNFHEYLLKVDVKKDTVEQLKIIQNEKFDLIVLTDIFEVTKDIYGFLRYLDTILKENGKIIINSINPKWNLFLTIFEYLKFKQNSQARSYIHHKKVYSIAESSGFKLNAAFTRQIFPFKFLKIGNFLNKILEIILFKFNLGINNYLILSKSNNKYIPMTKSIIIPAKNEEKNLYPLFSRIPDFETPYQIIIVCGKSKDLTLEEAQRIQEENPNIDIQVIQQESKGKGPGVLEAISLCKYELITVLDSDISVAPETLIDFFNIVEEGKADFVNGTRFVYKMEKGAMRKLNNLGNLFFQFIISIVINKKLTDSLCGTKVFKKTSIDHLYDWSNNLKIKDPFGDFDFIFSTAYSGGKILEYPVHYKARVYGTTQISRFSDGLRLLLYFINSFLIFNSSNNVKK
tara:strand:- start:950 stop:2272 length:1323 start_codon:yes stop_codon:yes gene_type:complete